MYCAYKSVTEEHLKDFNLLVSPYFISVAADIIKNLHLKSGSLDEITTWVLDANHAWFSDILMELCFALFSFVLFCLCL